MRRPVFAALLLLAATGCAHGPAPVDLPVATPCIDRADVPPAVPPVGALPDDARQAADRLGAVVLLLRANERLLRALVAPCAL